MTGVLEKMWRTGHKDEEVQDAADSVPPQARRVAGSGIESF